MNDPMASWVPLEGCFNFRDLGGYQTGDGARMQTGLVFRSDGLQHLTTADLDHLESKIRLGAIIDLRGDDEVEEDGSGGIVERGLIVHRLPLFPQTRSLSQRREVPRDMLANMGELYYFMLSFAKEPIAQVVSLLADATVPTVFHCAAGKDRTGVISALLLSILGVPDETIVADYALSRQNIDQINARLAQSGSYQAFMDDLPEGAYDADPAAMRFFLTKVQAEFGSMVEWATQAGIDAETQQKLRARLLR